MEHLTIGRLAKQLGVNLETVRYYERTGLLPKPPRLRSGYRSFPPSTVPRLRFIKRSQELGFSLAEIRQLLALRADPDRDCASVCQQARQKLTEVDQKIKELQRMQRALKRLTEACSGDRCVRECGILEVLDKDV